MQDRIQALYELSRKNERLIIGLMSGTSLDGLDIALCSCSGSGRDTQISLLAFETQAYSSEFRSAVSQVFAKQAVKHDLICWLNAYIAREHAAMVNQFLRKHEFQSDDIDLIASHGQTVYHRPLSLTSIEGHISNVPSHSPCNSTLQLGDGDHIASLTGIITLSDFRQKHIAHGGEGAPLAMYGDYLLLADKRENRCLVNIGGIANFTFLPANSAFSDTICSDIGPGNTLMDALVQQALGEAFDRDARLARTGKVNKTLFALLCKEPYVCAPLPKTTGPELFNLAWLSTIQANHDLTELPLEDLLATLNYFSAWCIASHIEKLDRPVEVYLSGGGAHNPLLCDNLKTLLGQTLHTTDELGLDGDAKEAILFALLANECVSGKPTSFGTGDTANNIANNRPVVSMGKISLPD